MIPTMIVVGLVLGRWWRLALLTSAVGWPVLLLVTGVDASVPGLVVGSVLAVANAGLGVLAHQACLRGWRHVRHHRSHAVAVDRP